MATIEQIVRPSTQEQVSPTQGLSTLPAVVSPVVVFVGGSGTGKVMNGNFSMETTVYIKKQQIEKHA